MPQAKTDDTYVPGVLHCRVPTSGTVPLVFDIPRSGNEYPCDFHSPASFDPVRRSVSMYVQELYARVTDAGATWLYALFPNVYIDANRHELDVDPKWVRGDWPVPFEPTDKSMRGMGLIPRVCGKGDVALQTDPIDAADLQHRLTHYYWPYHDRLRDMLATFRARHGAAYHVSCHSMSSVGGKAVADPGRKRSDFDIGTRHGTTCHADFANAVVSYLRGAGYDATVNEHFAGAESVRKHGNPAGGVHSLQIEINRGIYMDEDAYVRGPRFKEIQTHLGGLALHLAEFVRTRAK